MVAMIFERLGWMFRRQTGSHMVLTVEDFRAAVG